MMFVPSAQMIQYLTNCMLKKIAQQKALSKKKNLKNLNVTSQPIVGKINKYIK